MMPSFEGLASASRVILAGDILQMSELRHALELEGHEVATAETVADTSHKVFAEAFNLLILGSVVEGIAAYRLCRIIRTRSQIGIIVLGDQGGAGAIDALNAGADDCVSPPFVAAEILARVRAILRRVRPCRKRAQLVLQDRAVDLDSHQVKGPDGKVSRLTPKEFQVLRHLVTHPNKPRTRHDLAQTVWQRDGIGDVEYIRVVIKQLRRKLEPDPDHPRYILTEREVGYRFQLPSAEL